MFSPLDISGKISTYENTVVSTLPLVLALFLCLHARIAMPGRISNIGLVFWLALAGSSAVLAASLPRARLRTTLLQILRERSFLRA